MTTVAAKKAASKAVAKITSTLTLGAQIDALNAIRERKRELEGQVKKVAEEYEAAQQGVLDALEAQGMDKGSGKTATASISVTVVANIGDRDMLDKFIKRTGNFQLLQGRLSMPAVRELMEKKGGDIPGIVPFHKKTLNLLAL